MFGIPPRGGCPGNEQGSQGHTRYSRREPNPIAPVGRGGFRLGRLRAQPLRPRLPPFIQLVPIGEDRAALLQLQPMNRQFFL